MAKISSKPQTMEELLALHSAQGKPLNLSRGQEVEGEVVGVNERELILDLGMKSEGVIQGVSGYKVGDKLKAFVVDPENESSQVVLSLHPVAARPTRGARLPQGKILRGKVTELNKGGALMEVVGVRGFLPNSQVGFEFLHKAKDNIIGQEIPVMATETDAGGGRVIFSQKGTSKEHLERLQGFKNGQKIKGQISAMLPFGLVISLGDVPGLVFASDASWEKIEDLNSLFKVGQEVEALVLGVDESVGRLNLSIKQLIEDPFVKISQKFTPDSAVKGEVREVSENGVTFALTDPSGELGTSGVEGFLPASKMDPSQKYETDEKLTLLIDSVDVRRRKVNLTPLVTSTAGLIYK